MKEEETRTLVIEKVGGNRGYERGKNKKMVGGKKGQEVEIRKCRK